MPDGDEIDFYEADLSSVAFTDCVLVSATLGELHLRAVRCEAVTFLVPQIRVNYAACGCRGPTSSAPRGN